MIIDNGAADFAIKAITRDIEEGRYQVGSYLIAERSLCDILGVSRTTLRVALNYLMAKCVLKVSHGKGWKVCPIMVKDDCEAHY